MADLADYQWLTSDDARPWLARATEGMEMDPAQLVRLTKQLRRDLPAARTHLVLELAELRRRARAKFRQAEEMFFTRQSLEQATDEVVAAYKAARFSGGGRAADLCCGIGGDLIALGQRGPCVGIERDAILAHLARQNRAVFGAAETSVEVADASQFPAESVAGWHIDPDRRPGGKRTTKLEFYEPPQSVLNDLLHQNENAAIKLAPAADVPGCWQTSAEREWLESRGECRQQIAWFGSLARHPGKSAATITDAPGGKRTIVGARGEFIPTAARIGQYVYEPAAAVLAAKLTSVLCHEHSLGAVSPGIAYLTGDTLALDAALPAFKVLEVLPLDIKQLKTWLRERRIGRLEIKKRGADIDPEKFRKQLAGPGENEATLLICPLGEGVRAIVARRVK